MIIYSSYYGGLKSYCRVKWTESRRNEARKSEKEGEKGESIDEMSRSGVPFVVLRSGYRNHQPSSHTLNSKPAANRLIKLHPTNWTAGLTGFKRGGLGADVGIRTLKRIRFVPKWLLANWTFLINILRRENVEFCAYTQICYYIIVTLIIQ